MPWLTKPKKDVVANDIYGELANKRYQPYISEWGNPCRVMPTYPWPKT